MLAQKSNRTPSVLAWISRPTLRVSHRRQRSPPTRARVTGVTREPYSETAKVSLELPTCVRASAGNPTWQLSHCRQYKAHYARARAGDHGHPPAAGARARRPKSARSPLRVSSRSQANMATRRL
eukprot:7919638-Pyramimonas_sp.AAC.1